MVNSHGFYDTQSGQKIYLYKWLTAQKPKACLLLAHGMADHAGRYAEAAKALTEAGYLVWAPDHRAHGKTAQEGRVGVTSDVFAFQNMARDLSELLLKMSAEYPGLPLFLAGHSMGSFLIRSIMAKHASLLSGVVLSATIGPQGLLPVAGKLIALNRLFFKGPEYLSPFIHRMSFSRFNSRIRNVRTEFDWITRDEAKVDAYKNDPFCGHPLSCAYYYGLFDGLQFIQDIRNIRKLPRQLPLYLFSGTSDPVGDWGKGVEAVYRMFRKAGLQNVTLKLYPGGRHESLSETNRQEVTSDLISWLDSQYSSSQKRG